MTSALGTARATRLGRDELPRRPLPFCLLGSGFCLPTSSIVMSAATLIENAAVKAGLAEPGAVPVLIADMGLATLNRWYPARSRMKRTTVWRVKIAPRPSGLDNERPPPCRIGRPQLLHALRVVVAGRCCVLGPPPSTFSQIVRHPRLAQPGAERVPPTVENGGSEWESNPTEAV